MDSTLAYTAPEYKGAKDTTNIGTEFYDPGESELYPDGLESFNNMVYVINIEECSNDAGHPAVVEYYGEWYYYYGNGEYGVTKEKGDTVYTQRHFGERDYYFSLPDVADGCNRYFFYLPKIWENELSQTAGIYWYLGTDAHDAYPGVEAHKADAEGLYYYDVPKDVTDIVWNNMLAFDIREEGWRESLEYKLARKTRNIQTDFYELGDSELYPNGVESFNNMVWVVDFSSCTCMDYDSWDSIGEWYYYYGNGEYGTTPERGDVVYTDRSIGEYCPHQRHADSGKLPEIEEGCNRYFFYMPDEWYNESAAKGPGIYWNTGTSSSDEFPGTPLKYTDIEGLYYFDVPASVDEFYWTNLFDGGDDFTDPAFCDAMSASSRPYDADEDFRLQDCNGMVFVVDFAYIDYDEETGKMVCHGKWFVHYGNGEYGTECIRGDGEIYTDKSFNGIKAEPIVLPYYIGDADKDGKVNVKDATAIQKHLADIDECFTVAADVDDSGNINIKDATTIQKYVAGINTGYPIGKIRYA